MKDQHITYIMHWKSFCADGCPFLLDTWYDAGRTLSLRRWTKCRYVWKQWKLTTTPCRREGGRSGAGEGRGRAADSKAKNPHIHSGGGWNHRQGGCFLLFFLPPHPPFLLLLSLLSSSPPSSSPLISMELMGVRGAWAPLAPTLNPPLHIHATAGFI